MKVLVFGTLFIADEKRAELTELWIQNQHILNPGCDYLLIDSCSEEIWCAFTPTLQRIPRIVVAEDTTLPPLQSGLNWVSFSDNIGHLSHHGRDGWGRAFCRGLQYAIDYGYDYVAHIEADVLTRIGVTEMIARLQRHNLAAVAPIYGSRWLCEVGHMIMDVAHLREHNFIEKYDWKNLPKDEAGKRPEDLVEQILNTDLLFINLRGGRNEDRKGEELFCFDEVEDMEYITHAKDFKMYLKFMIANFPQYHWHPIYEQNYVT